MAGLNKKEIEDRGARRRSGIMAGLNKKEIEDRDRMLDELREARDAVKVAAEDADAEIQKSFEVLRAAVDAHNEAVEAAFAPVKEAVDAYNETLDAIRSFYADQESDAQSTFDERSEKWQESDKGQAFQAWIESLGAASVLDDLEVPTFDPIEIDDPPEIEVPEDVDEHVETIEGVADGPE